MTIERRAASWMCDRVKGFGVFLESESTFAPIFEAGGYIAGGFLRALLQAGTIDVMGPFFRKHGDVDVFCPNIDVFNKIKEKYKTKGWKPSMGKNAEQCDIHLRRKDPIWNVVDEDSLDTPLILQLVSCMYHEPITMLETFDITNCKIAFDGRSIYIDDRIEALEQNRMLQLDMSSPTLGARLEKYFRKHGYKTLHPESKGILMAWLMDRPKAHDAGFKRHSR